MLIDCYVCGKEHENRWASPRTHTTHYVCCGVCSIKVHTQKGSPAANIAAAQDGDAFPMGGWDAHVESVKSRHASIKFFGDKARAFQKEQVLSCKSCHNFYPYSEPNQKDGSLICWSCRN